MKLPYIGGFSTPTRHQMLPNFQYWNGLYLFELLAKDVPYIPKYHTLFSMLLVAFTT